MLFAGLTFGDAPGVAPSNAFTLSKKLLLVMCFFIGTGFLGFLGNFDGKIMISSFFVFWGGSFSMDFLIALRVASRNEPPCCK